MKYFYAIYDNGVHSVFKPNDSKVKHGFCDAHFDLPWDDLENRLNNALYNRDYMQQSVFSNGYFMGGPGGRGVMIVMLDYDTSNSKRPTSKEVYDACMERIKSLIREEKIKRLL